MDETDLQSPETAVLFSGGLDSAVLLADQASRGPAQPIYVAAGLGWEAAELQAVGPLLAAMPFARALAPLVRLSVDMRDVYPPTHWAVVGNPPAYHTPDEDVYIEGRNVVLLSKAAVYCARRRIRRLVIGPLAGNPFPDATPEFFTAMARALSLGLAHDLSIDAPFSALHKEDVIGLGVGLGVPLGLTLSCMNPSGNLHCGRCSKCRERQQAFAAAGLTDPAGYAGSAPPPA
jgi:7-cyano-7-deazaguanine synthase